ncbi:hypothetical protein EHS19_02225 [Bifidobacterium jacchi]|uniref:Uncharacterized protein n=1 Tax=Bifidobacterium jacchi TaxID=2490545 RepID=A0A5N5RLF0_9BIFI|nr:hypothetical protein EHS19_02225 [Bifidobacterium jacchi]
MTGADAGVGIVHLIGVVRNVGMARLVLMAHLVGVVRAHCAGIIAIVAGGYPHSRFLHILRAIRQMVELQAKNACIVDNFEVPSTAPRSPWTALADRA